MLIKVQVTGFSIYEVKQKCNNIKIYYLTEKSNNV